MKSPPLGPVGEDITWPDQVAPQGRKASTTRKIKPQTSNLKPSSKPQDSHPVFHFLFFSAPRVLCTPSGVLLRPDPWSGCLLDCCFYGNCRPHLSIKPCAL